jgi:hypothetical protein
MSLVPQLKGPFDFVFSDADKDWYKNYFIAVDPNLKVGGVMSLIISLREPTDVARIPIICNISGV